MPSINEALNSGKPPLGSTLADGIRALSANQQIAFSLYRKYVFPLDGMVYWIRVPSSSTPVTTPGIQASPGLASATVQDAEAIQVVPGWIGASDIVGGIIVNPPDAIEPLFVDFTGPCYCREQLGTKALAPGQSIEIPDHPRYGAWVNAATGGHKFTVVVRQSVPSVTKPTDVLVTGSLHYDSAIDQREDAVVDSNTVVFSSLEEIQEFNEIGPDYMYIGRYRNLLFAFSSRGRLYEQADLYHYLGKAQYSIHDPQIIDDPDEFNPTLVVNNSLPIWINMANYVPPYPGFVCPLPLFPSFLVTDNLEPPFGAVHIDSTQALHETPIYGRYWESNQVCRDKVRVTLYGTNARMAADFRDFVLQYSRDWNLIGMAQPMPHIFDEKHPQPEFKFISHRKAIEFEVNYLQSVARDQAQQFILGAKVQFIPQWLQL